MTVTLSAAPLPPSPYMLGSAFIVAVVRRSYHWSSRQRGPPREPWCPESSPSLKPYSIPCLWYIIIRASLIQHVCMHTGGHHFFFLVGTMNTPICTSAAGCWHIRGFRMPWHHHGCVIIGLSTDRRLHHNKIIDWPIRSLYSHELMPVPTISWYH